MATIGAKKARAVLSSSRFSIPVLLWAVVAVQGKTTRREHPLLTDNSTISRSSITRDRSPSRGLQTAVVGGAAGAMAAAHRGYCRPPEGTTWVIGTNHKTGTYLMSAIVGDVSREFHTELLHHGTVRSHASKPLPLPIRAPFENSSARTLVPILLLLSHGHPSLVHLFYASLQRPCSSSETKPLTNRHFLCF